MTDSKFEAVRNLEAVQTGEKDVHVWRGNLSPWMHLVYVEKGAELPEDAQPAGWSDEFIAATGTYYDGIMPPEEALQRLSELRGYKEA